MNLEKKHVLVTAAGQGIGRASAIAFARAGDPFAAFDAPSLTSDRIVASNARRTIRA